jgi:hypothetical protein
MRVSEEKSMAPTYSHAGGNNRRSFEIQVLPEHGEPTELAAGLTDFLEAVELATDWLAREDPRREGSTGVAIFALRDGGAPESVWQYPPPQQPAAQRTLVDTFGFDPVGWVSAVQEFKGERRLPTPAPASPPLHAVEAQQPASEPGPRAVRLPKRRHEAVPLVRSAWEDPVSRACLIVGAASLWLSLTLVEARFLALLLLALTGLWWRRDHRAAAAAEAANDAELL